MGEDRPPLQGFRGSGCFQPQGVALGFIRVGPSGRLGLWDSSRWQGFKELSSNTEPEAARVSQNQRSASSLKGWLNVAQGNALGWGQNEFRPEGAD